jgi:putative transposase
MARVKALTDRTIAERFAEIKTEDQVWGDISMETKQLAERILGSALEDELQHRLQAGRYKRTEVRRGYRNGGYWRTVASRWGVLDVLQPRARTAQPGSTVLRRFQRREAEVDELIRQAFLRGVSTRQVGPCSRRCSAGSRRPRPSRRLPRRWIRRCSAITGGAWATTGCICCWTG